MFYILSNYFLFLFLGVDDAESECNLDDIQNWDLIIENENKNVEDKLQNILNLI